MWKTPVKHKKCALSFKMDNGAAHAISAMIGVIKGFDVGMFGQYLMYFFFEFAFAETMYDPDLNLAFEYRIINSCIEGFELKLDGIFIIHLAAFELRAIDVQVYLLTEHGSIGLAAAYRIGSSHHVAAQEICIELL